MAFSSPHNTDKQIRQYNLDFKPYNKRFLIFRQIYHNMEEERGLGDERYDVVAVNGDAKVCGPGLHRGRRVGGAPCGEAMTVDGERESGDGDATGRGSNAGDS
jgi:hypothetical protein